MSKRIMAFVLVGVMLFASIATICPTPSTVVNAKQASHAQMPQIMAAQMKNAIYRAMYQEIHQANAKKPGEDPNPGAGPTVTYVRDAWPASWTGSGNNKFQDPNTTRITNSYFGPTPNFGALPSASDAGTASTGVSSNNPGDYGVEIAFITCHWRLTYNNGNGQEVSNDSWFKDNPVALQNKTTKITVNLTASLASTSTPAGGYFTNTMVWIYAGGVPDSRYPPPGYNPYWSNEVFVAYPGTTIPTTFASVSLTTQLKNLTAGNPDHPSEGIIIVGIGSAVGGDYTANTVTSGNINLNGAYLGKPLGVYMTWPV